MCIHSPQSDNQNSLHSLLPVKKLQEPGHPADTNCTGINNAHLLLKHQEDLGPNLVQLLEVSGSKGSGWSFQSPSVHSQVVKSHRCKTKSTFRQPMDHQFPFWHLYLDWWWSCWMASCCYVALFCCSLIRCLSMYYWFCVRWSFGSTFVDDEKKWVERRKEGRNV